MPFRDAVKKILHGLGVFSAYHRLRNRETLTVVMFHRVLPEDVVKHLQPDPPYTVTTDFFAAALAFLQRHYTVVSLQDILDAKSRIRPLPARALLITFDDGWHDNLQYALPLLKKAQAPAVVFVTMDALGPAACWWQEALLWALRTGRANFEQLWNLPAGMKPPLPGRGAKPVLELLLHYGALPPDARENLIRPFADELQAKSPSRQTLSPEDLPALKAGGFAIGSHGSSHLPLTRIAHASRDLADAKRWLMKNCDPVSAETLSFPHGRYDARIVAAARDAGYRLMFTSNEIVNECPGGWITNDLIGRIAIEPGGNGVFSAHNMAPHLFSGRKKILADPAR